MSPSLQRQKYHGDFVLLHFPGESLAAHPFSSCPCHHLGKAIGTQYSGLGMAY